MVVIFARLGLAVLGALFLRTNPKLMLDLERLMTSFVTLWSLTMLSKASEIGKASMKSSPPTRSRQ